MSTFTLSTTQKNKPLLLCNGFTYTIDKINNDKTYWKCEHARTMKCKGRVHTNCINTIILNETDNHNHLGSAVSSEIRIFEEKIRVRAVNCNETTQTIIENCLTNLPDEAVARLPNFKHIKRNIQHHRLKNDLPKIPHDKTFDRIPDKLATTKRNNKFLQFDSGPGNDRLIIFSSADQLQLLDNCEELLVDGTFKVTPTIFYQLYVMHVVYRKAVIPVIFALLPNKTQQTYQRLINELVQICPAWNPKSIMMDFEQAAINAFGDTFATTTNPSTISGCFFHLQQSIQRKVQELGFKTNYEQDLVFAHNVNKIAALAFLQPADISQGFDDLYNASPPILRPLFDYFEDTYVGRHRPQGRSKPMFSIELWNMHQRTTDLSMRTNNSAEAWNRRFNSITQCQHPTLWSFIESLQNEEHFIHCQLVKLNAGQNIEPNEKYLNYSKRLCHLITNPHPTLLQQLEGLAHNL
ncbi:unnamed protein product [Rotaria sordida]|uniref:MULE transposase domain-containing protein n=1 Tax=Rotaria sordida TaxID=392033 RepID=A0A819BEY0_9BILA|nr:unnamed protein product [Rotaria sordida]CAF1544724.1 unnamed protein product [Rotaria sordida]CAF3800226.1 unnamed protein product [Rotaria sordida]CAF4221931.1 unnamed protein product [Rotaria sordida]